MRRNTASPHTPTRKSILWDATTRRKIIHRRTYTHTRAGEQRSRAWLWTLLIWAETERFGCEIASVTVDAVRPQPFSYRVYAVPETSARIWLGARARLNETRARAQRVKKKSYIERIVERALFIDAYVLCAAARCYDGSFFRLSRTSLLTNFYYLHTTTQIRVHESYLLFCFLIRKNTRATSRLVRSTFRRAFYIGIRNCLERPSAHTRVRVYVKVYTSRVLITASRLADRARQRVSDIRRRSSWFSGTGTNGGASGSAHSFPVSSPNNSPVSLTVILEILNLNRDRSNNNIYLPVKIYAQNVIKI